MHIKVIHTKLDVTLKTKYNDNKKQRSVFGMYMALPKEFF